MKNLEYFYNVERDDLVINDKKLLEKYSKITRKHKYLDLRFNTPNSSFNDLLSINVKSINKIFDFLEHEIPEEHILYLFEKKTKEKKHKSKKSKNEYIIDTTSQNNEQINETKEENDENEEKREFLTLEVENPVLKKFKTLTHQIMKTYYFIFCILCFIIAILFTIHLFKYLISKYVSLNHLFFIDENVQIYYGLWIINIFVCIVRLLLFY
jgi:hypothetical protein